MTYQKFSQHILIYLLGLILSMTLLLAAIGQSEQYNFSDSAPILIAGAEYIDLLPTGYQS